MSMVSFWSWECSDQVEVRGHVPYYLRFSSARRLDPGIHVFFCLHLNKQDVDGRVKPGHDETGGVPHMSLIQPRLRSGPFGPK